MAHCHGVIAQTFSDWFKKKSVELNLLSEEAGIADVESGDYEAHETDGGGGSGEHSC